MTQAAQPLLAGEPPRQAESSLTGGTLDRPDRPAMLDALVVDGERRHGVIEASAGTGKTHTLEHLVIDLLLEGTPIEKILVVTFTEKATLEMRARIRQRIGAMVREGASQLRPALANFDRASISTIHGFCQRVLAEHAFASSRLLEQQRVDPRLLFASAFRQAVRVTLSSQHEHRALMQASLAALRPALLEERLWQWSQHATDDIEPHFDAVALHAALSFFPARDSVDGPVGRGLVQSAHASIRPRLQSCLQGLASVVSQIHQRGLDGAWEELFEWAAAAPHRRAALNCEVLADALSAHAAAAEPAAVIARMASSPLPALVHLLLPQIMERVADAKRRAGQFDFDDLLGSLRDALAGPAGAGLARTLQERYRFALVDEFQDTDPTQWEIFRRIFFQSDTAQRLVVIGDPKQSIYSFRRADVRTYLRARDEITSAGGVRIALTDNFRSTVALVHATNTLLQEGVFTGPNRYDHPVRAARTDLRAVLAGGDPAPALTLMHLWGGPRGLRAKPTRFAHALAIAQEIEQLLEGSLRVGREGELRRLLASDIFVLARSTKELGEVSDALGRRGLAFAISTQEGVFSTRQARDILDVIAALGAPTERGLRLRAFLTPFFAVAQDDLEASRTLSSEHPLVARVYRWAQLAEAGRYAALFQAMMDESGLARRLAYLREGERELVNYGHIFELLLARAHRDRLTVHELRERLQALVDGSESSSDDALSRLEGEREAVQLLTMHKSKGLEAEVVFVFGGLTSRLPNHLEPKIFHRGERRVAFIGVPTPHVRAELAEEERQESERLLYVALTRARSCVYLPYVGPPPRGTTAPPKRVSHFERLTGPYRILNDRLVHLATHDALGQDQSPGGDLSVRGNQPLGEPNPAVLHARVLPVDVGAMVRRFGAAPQLPAAPPPTPDLEIPLVTPATYERLRARAVGVEITSYTRMKAGRTGESGPEHEGAAEWASSADAPSVAELDAELDERQLLPSGAAFGVFIHEVLERIDFTEVARASDAAALLSHQATRDLLEQRARRNGVAASAIALSATMIHRALCTPIRSGDLLLPKGLAGVDRKLAEMSFLHPISEAAHPAFGIRDAASAAPLQVERGFVRGIVDLVFENQGRVWILDWKTDRLPSYAPERIGPHVSAHYDIQARLYTLGLVRALRLAREQGYEARFGGIVYCFVRGIAEPDEPSQGTLGIWTDRPSFQTVQAWEHTLRSEREPWGYMLPPGRAGAA
ncbi:MAG: UvrD-helicase domain-containing protein [Kofleriaceae bacterium]|nr:UvrD-helicase domain-containing protein [Kofleriaceae bacterium]